MSIINFFLHEFYHSLFYLFVVVLFLFARKYKTIPSKNIIAGYITTILLDTDHLIDYFIYKKQLIFDIKEFLSGIYFLESKKTYILLHAWEWAILIFIIYILTKRKYGFLVFIIIGILSQLIFDTISYHFNPLGYSLLFRVVNSFNGEVF